MKTGMMHGDSRFKPYLEPGFERPKEIVEILPRLVLSGCADPDIFIERANFVGDLAAEKRIGGDSADPDVLFCAPAWAGRTSGAHRHVVLVAHQGQECAELGMRIKPTFHGIEKVLRIPTVIVGKTDDVPFGKGQTHVTSPRKPAPGAKMPNVQLFVPGDDRDQPVVRVLVDQDNFKILV